MVLWTHLFLSLRMKIDASFSVHEICSKRHWRGKATMQNPVLSFLKVLWVIAAFWMAVVFFTGLSGEWEKMDTLVKLMSYCAISQVLASAAWSAPKSWRHSEIGVISIMVFGMSSAFTIVESWALAATTHPSEAPVLYAASVALTLHCALHVGLAIYAARASEKRRHREWDTRHGFAGLR